MYERILAIIASTNTLFLVYNGLVFRKWIKSFLNLFFHESLINFDKQINYNLFPLQDTGHVS
jgi:hypothetical protein